MMNANTALLFFSSVILAATLLTSCGATAPRQDAKRAAPGAPELRVSSLGKTDIDSVAEIHQQESLGHLRILMEKLYRLNPREWKKSGQASVEQAVIRAFDSGADWDFPELNGKRGADCFYLAFQEGYQGDRVLAFIAGLSTMIMSSYNDKTSFYVLDELDSQKLYNSARNVEIAVWKLSNTRDSRGELFLVSNRLEGGSQNLSFEREFGKLIAQQDTLARIVAQKTNRSIVRALQSVASLVFLPI